MAARAVRWFTPRPTAMATCGVRNEADVPLRLQYVCYDLRDVARWFTAGTVVTAEAPGRCSVPYGGEFRVTQGIPPEARLLTCVTHPGTWTADMEGVYQVGSWHACLIYEHAGWEVVAPGALVPACVVEVTDLRTERRRNEWLAEIAEGARSWQGADLRLVPPHE